MTLREEADKIIKEAITKVLPDEAVKQALKNRKTVKGKLYLVAVGKAAWQMANAAANILNGQIEKGIVITKYGHIQETFRGSNVLKQDIRFRIQIPLRPHRK